MKIGILGAGTWGLALARNQFNAGHEVTVWSALPEEVDELARTRRQRNLPGMIIPSGIVFTKDISEACADKDIILSAVPSVFVRSTAKTAAPYIKDGQIIVDVAKGIEAETFLTLSEVILSEIPQSKVVALSGPTHAEEVARDLPTTIVAAHEDIKVAEFVQEAFTNNILRVYTNTDVKGVEICGALKNIIALATGIATGLGYGDNIKAAIMTRGLAEIARIGSKLGCLPETFSGLAGMGDLIVTAMSRHSRNNRCGQLLGEGLPTEEAVKLVGMVVEGINAIPAAIAMSEKYDVDMPIIRAVDRVVNQGADPDVVITDLMERDSGTELVAHP